MKPVTSMSIARIAIGALSVARPDLAAKAFRLDQISNPQLPYMTRMFGSREVFIGVVTLFSKGRARRAFTGLGIAIDGSDAYAGYEAGRTGAVSQSTSGVLTAPAVLAVVAGLVGLFERDRAKAAKRALEANED
ncbi:MAG: hypothetical protein ACTHOG_06985 [Marmoricola sp.]